MSTRTLRCAVFAAPACLAIVETASAYYDPRSGRFIRCDSIGEPGAMLARGEIDGRPAGKAFIPPDRSEAEGSNRNARMHENRWTNADARSRCGHSNHGGSPGEGMRTAQ